MASLDLTAFLPPKILTQIAPEDCPAPFSLSDTLTPIQIQVLQCLVAGQSVTAAAKEAGLHRTPFELQLRAISGPAPIPTLPAPCSPFARLVDELGDLGDLAINTLRQILSDERPPPASEPQWKSWPAAGPTSANSKFRSPETRNSISPSFNHLGFFAG